MIHGQEMEISLGLPVIIENFKDGVPRQCYPITLSNLTMANIYLSSFDMQDIRKNFLNLQTTQAMSLFFQMAFRPKNEDEVKSLLYAIDENNFEEIVNDIKTISGIKDMDKQVEKTYNVAGEKISWNRMVNIIPLYTSTPHVEIRNMTLVQLNETLELIQKKINWDYKISTMGLTKEPNKHLDKKDSMFYEEPKVGSQKVTTMKEIMGFTGGE